MTLHHSGHFPKAEVGSNTPACSTSETIFQSHLSMNLHYYSSEALNTPLCLPVKFESWSEESRARSVFTDETWGSESQAQPSSASLRITLKHHGLELYYDAFSNWQIKSFLSSSRRCLNLLPWNVENPPQWLSSAINAPAEPIESLPERQGATQIRSGDTKMIFAPPRPL